MQRVVCTQHVALNAELTPIFHRSGLATRPLVEIDSQGGMLLLCDRAHRGPCEWPGDVVTPDRLADLTVVARGDHEPTARPADHPAGGDLAAQEDDHGDEPFDDGDR